MTSGPALMQSAFDDRGKENLEVLVRQSDGKLHHYYRVKEGENFMWKEAKTVSPAENVMSTPSFIQGTHGPFNDNFELLVREEGKVRHYFRKRVSQDEFEWRLGDDVN